MNPFWNLALVRICLSPWSNTTQINSIHISSWAYFWASTKNAHSDFSSKSNGKPSRTVCYGYAYERDIHSGGTMKFLSGEGVGGHYIKWKFMRREHKQKMYNFLKVVVGFLRKGHGQPSPALGWFLSGYMHQGFTRWRVDTYNQFDCTVKHTNGLAKNNGHLTAQEITTEEVAQGLYIFA